MGRLLQTLRISFNGPFEVVICCHLLCWVPSPLLLQSSMAGRLGGTRTAFCTTPRGWICRSTTALMVSSRCGSTPPASSASASPSRRGWSATRTARISQSGPPCITRMRICDLPNAHEPALNPVAMPICCMSTSTLLSCNVCFVLFLTGSYQHIYRCRCCTVVHIVV